MYTGPIDDASIFSEENNEDAISDCEELELKLESFQEELVEPCLNGENKIILAPTNSGKTYVAMAIAKVCMQGFDQQSLNMHICGYFGNIVNHNGPSRSQYIRMCAYCGM